MVSLYLVKKSLLYQKEAWKWQYLCKEPYLAELNASEWKKSKLRTSLLG